MTGKIIENGWTELSALWLSPAAGQQQRDEMRMAFFAGAQHLLVTMMKVMSPDAEPTDADLLIMDSIHAELTAFGELLHLTLHGKGGTA